MLVSSALTSLLFGQAMHLLVIIFFFSIHITLGNPLIRSTNPHTSQPDDFRPNNYNLRGDYFSRQPQSSYIIYDGDVTNVPGRPQMSSTRSWHLEFNQRKQTTPSRQSPPIAYGSIYSNLIQIYDKPQNKYYGEYDNNYHMPNGDKYNYYIRSRPIDVPKYDVIYPNESDRQNYYYREKLPENFPIPFSPNKEFELKEPSLPSDVRKDYGFYHAQTISYPDQEDDRGSRRDNCNYIKLNEKGFPIGNEMCGRSISDIILAPDYPNTGELVLEHRKRYRGTYQDRGLESNKINSFKRKKRNTENISERFREFNSYNPSGACCGEILRTGYGYRPQIRQELDSNRFMSRPYGGDRNIDSGFEYRGQGQYYNNNEDDVGEETSDNHGLTSYMLNRGRGNNRYRENDDNYGDEEENSSGGYGSRGGNRNSSENRRNVSNSSNGSQGNSRRSNNRNWGSSNESSKRNGGNSETSNSQENSRSVNNWRNFDRSEFEDDNNNRGGLNNRNGGQNYGYSRNNENGRNSGSNIYYGQRFSGYNDGFRSDSSMGENNYRNSGPYGNYGYPGYNRFTR